MQLRLLNLGLVSPLYSQAVYHGLASNMQAHDLPVLILVRPDQAYISVGLHQDIEKEIDIDYCQRNNLQIIRRHVGGGSVLLDENQLFFQFVFPSKLLPNKPAEIYTRLLQPVLHCFQSMGIAAYSQSLNDIQVNAKKIAGTGAATIDNANVLVGGFLFDFNCAQMAACINAPSEAFKHTFAELMRNRMTSIRQEKPSLMNEKDIIQFLKKHIETDLSLTVVDSRLNHNEQQAIQQAEQELLSDEWTFMEGRKLVSNGIKISAGLYLLENQFDWMKNDISIRVIFHNKHIEKIWLESDVKQSQLTKLCQVINQNQPAINKPAILKLLQDQLENRSDIPAHEIEALTSHIYQLANIDEY